MQNLKLNNGVSIPEIGFGTWQIPDGETTAQAVKTALEYGYTHIDTAACYQNEIGVGRAIRESGVPREKLFVTTKLWNTERGYDSALRAFAASLQKLQLEYLDLYLIHWPDNKNPALNTASWQALEKLYQEGLIKALGVSNFKPRHLQPLLDTAEIKPAVNQIEYHPGFRQEETVEFCQKHHILVEAWSPLGSGRILQNPDLQRIAQKYNKSTAQLCLRWCRQNGTLPLPKSITPERIKENAQALDFEISAEDMQRINALPQFGWSGSDPDKMDF
ncbi:MAG: aldo/keto reductase [Candidatus Margulisbacteria bacterium]|jgi:diketogulonate reductase-like aldo/keto reductase|nr:aldo/keto reductase [Candidatus Margulisiibacteriota bacterium]